MADKKKPPSFGKIDSHHSDLLMARVAAFMPEIKAANETLQKDVTHRIDDALIQEGSDDDEKNDAEEMDENQQTVQLDVALSELESNKEVFDLLLPKTSSDEEETDGKEEIRAERNSIHAVGKPLSNLLECDERKCARPNLLIQEM
mmetsp:Transcript_10841/g.15975  ORF Transcript_10841/g.15975 Transcript_10841/m.15975 type:complete len:146 (-) Transcript_10841:3555-3992(-)